MIHMTAGCRTNQSSIKLTFMFSPSASRVRTTDSHSEGKAGMKGQSKKGDEDGEISAKKGV